MSRRDYHHVSYDDDEQRSALERELGTAKTEVDVLPDFYTELFRDARTAGSVVFDPSKARDYAHAIDDVEREVMSVARDSAMPAMSRFFKTADTVKSALEPVVNNAHKHEEEMTSLNNEVFAANSSKKRYTKYLIAAAIVVVLILILVVGLFAGGVIRVGGAPVPTVTPQAAPKTMTSGPGPDSTISMVSTYPAWQAGDGPDASESGPPYVPVPRVSLTGPGGAPANPPGAWFNTGMNGPRGESYITPFKSVEFPQQHLFYRYAYNG
jgi:hypothetical protein